MNGNPATQPSLHSDICLSSDTQSSDSQRKPSFNGELNGLLGAVGLLGAGDRSTMAEGTGRSGADINNTQESQIM